jgi:hypothetical protein
MQSSLAGSLCSPMIHSESTEISSSHSHHHEHITIVKSLWPRSKGTYSNYL